MDVNTKTTPFLNKKPSSLRYFQEGVVPIDIEKWRLRIFGEVGDKIELTYDDLLSLPKIYQNRRNVCVCLWSIKRHWDGVLLRDVLDLAGVDYDDPKLYMKQLSYGTRKGAYDSTVHLASAVKRDAMLAYMVDGQELPLEQGHPLRFIDFGLYLYKCVKAISSIEITRNFEIGYWEEYAGYNKNGIIQPKKYYAVDLQRKFFFDGDGEVTDHDL
ncbi:molybdopterin-dependent oxidoreductase [Halomonas sp. Y3]|uniref:molybdopterin-dependent oxidoreductase n=1 Tax=Halomonas sp. Y3 TaxID=2956797 RepID=UPI0020A1E8DF|nr:molybdopterin-dependent oxidoreductase [Halomonas sp. Y3]